MRRRAECYLLLGGIREEAARLREAANLYKSGLVSIRRAEEGPRVRRVGRLLRQALDRLQDQHPDR